MSKRQSSTYLQAFAEIISTLPRWYFRQCEVSRNLIHCCESCLHKLQKSSQKQFLQQRLLVLLGESLTTNVDHLESVEVSRQRQSFIFSISEKSSPRWFFNNKMASSQNPVRKHFSSLPLLRPKIVWFSTVGNTPGCLNGVWDVQFLSIPVLSHFNRYFFKSYEKFIFFTCCW